MPRCLRMLLAHWKGEGGERKGFFGGWVGGKRERESRVEIRRHTCMNDIMGYLRNTI